MTGRTKLVIAYDGAPFAGWQSQLHRNTIQDQLEAAVHRITGEPARVHGAGRTDTGVHALGQCAHLDLVTDKFEPEALRTALNAVLPSSLRVLRCQRVSATFHARFSAIGKVYRYRIWNGPVLPPFEEGRVWHITSALDEETLRAVLSLYKGRHDFAGFAASGGKPAEDTVRTIRTARLKRRGHHLTIELEGDGFLYKMVRLLVGTMVLCSQGKMTVSDVSQRLREGAGGGRRLVAPAAGLILVRVRY